MKERLEAEIINGAIAIKSGRETVMSFTGASVSLASGGTVGLKVSSAESGDDGLRIRCEGDGIKAAEFTLLRRAGGIAAGISLEASEKLAAENSVNIAF